MEKLTIKDVQAKYNNEEYVCKLDYDKFYRSKIKEGTVIDENQTVKWNREEVIRLNEEIQQKRNFYNEECNKLSRQLTADITLALMNDYDINEAQAKYVYDYVYREYSSCFSDTFIYLDEIMDLIIKFNDAK